MLYPTELRAQLVNYKSPVNNDIRLLTEYYILVYYTTRMNEKTGLPETGDQSKTWQSTQYANVVRHIPSGIYYARLRVKGKLIWRSLQTDKISIAKLKLADVEAKEHKKAEAGYVRAKDKILTPDYVDAYRQKQFRPSHPSLLPGLISQIVGSETDFLWS